MHQEPRQAQQPIEPHTEVKVRKNRFQIVKLEDRIAPHRLCYVYRGHRYCVKHSHGGGHGGR